MAQTTIEISKEYLHFHSAHFTIFSASSREDLHGHSFYVTADVTAPVADDGLAFDYNILKDALKTLCDALDEKLLLPEQSPHLALRREPLFDGQEYLVASFNGEQLPFLARDVVTLPLRNISVEELAPWFLQQLRSDDTITVLDFSKLTIKVSSGPGQWAGSTWQRGTDS
jgi:6-pyruvoyltetrahydropterin/6-carboxytetrahydropterin synthase